MGLSFGISDGSPPEGGISRDEIGSSWSFHGVVIVELDSESGSLLPLTMPWSKGEKSSPIPGNVGPRASRGTKSVDQRGAKLVESSEDILEGILPQ